MSENLENNVRRAFSEIRERFVEFDSMHTTKYSRHLRLIEEGNNIKKGQLVPLFNKYCTMPFKRFAEQVYDNRSKKNKIPDIPYKEEFRND